MNVKFLVTLFCINIISASNAQVKKVYAFKQASIPGSIIGNDETDIKDGNVKTERKQNFNYWFYLSIPKKEKVKITGLWIDGIQYEIKQDSITDLPVKKIIYTGLEKNDTIIMAPVTTNKIVLIYPGAGGQKNTGNQVKLAKTNELVIRYVWKNKTYYTSIKKIKELTPDVRV